MYYGSGFPPVLWTSSKRSPKVARRAVLYFRKLKFITQEPDFHSKCCRDA